MRAPRGSIHGYRTIADIMRAFNPFTGEMYREALQMSRLTREMFCLMEGRHVHPSTLYPGGVGTVATPQVFTDYLVRLLKVLDFVKKAVPVNDDVFDFFYEALPGYEEVGRRRIMLGCWGAFQDPSIVDYDYRNMNTWGRANYVTPGIVLDGELRTTNLVDINLGIRILLGSSYYKDWADEHTFVTQPRVGAAPGFYFPGGKSSPAPRRAPISRIHSRPVCGVCEVVTVIGPLRKNHTPCSFCQTLKPWRTAAAMSWSILSAIDCHLLSLSPSRLIFLQKGRR